MYITEKKQKKIRSKSPNTLNRFSAIDLSFSVWCFLINVFFFIYCFSKFHTKQFQRHLIRITIHRDLEDFLLEKTFFLNVVLLNIICRLHHFRISLYCRIILRNLIILQNLLYTVLSSSFLAASSLSL